MGLNLPGEHRNDHFQDSSERDSKDKRQIRKLGDLFNKRFGPDWMVRNRFFSEFGESAVQRRRWRRSRARTA